MQVVLVMFRADGARKSFPLSRDITVIGRREDCDLRIPLTEISRKHCRIVKEAGVVRIEDLGSSNGTYHNGNRIQEIEIQAGDVIQIGPVAFACQIDGFPADDMIKPPHVEDVEGSSAGSKIDDSSVGGLAEADEPVSTHNRTTTPMTNRPLMPTGDDFPVTENETNVPNDDIIDLGVSPTDDKR